MKTFILILNMFIALAVYMKTRFAEKSFGEVTQRKSTTLRKLHIKNGKQHINNGKYCIFQNIVRESKGKEIKEKSLIPHFKQLLEKASVGKDTIEKSNFFATNDIRNDKRDRPILKKFKGEKQTNLIHTQIKDKNKLKRSKATFAGIWRVRRNSMNCLNYGSCRNNVNQDLPVCYCDAFCVVYNDCCHDSKEKPEITKKKYIDLKSKLNYMSCELIIPQFSLDKSRGYLFVTKCPISETKHKMKQMCENKNYLLPVTGDDGLPYMNEYCAKCHSVNISLRWKITFNFESDCRIALNELIDIMTSDGIMQLIESKGCIMHPIPPRGASGPRICWNIDQINLENAQNITLCMNYQNPIARYVPDRYIWTRNAFCWQSYQPEHIYCAEAMNTSGFGLSLHSMSALFDFNRYMDEPNSQKCIENEKEKCRFEAIIGNCILEIHIKILTNGSYDIWLRVSALSQVIFEQLFIPWTLKNKDMEHFIEHANTINKYPCLDSMNCFLINLKLIMTVNETISFREVTEFIKALRQMKWTYIEKDLRDSWNNTIATFDFSFPEVNIPDDAESLDYLKLIKFTKVVNQQVSVFKGNLTTIPKYLEVIGGYISGENAIHDNANSYKILNILFNISEVVNHSKNRKTENLGFNWNDIHVLSTYVNMGTSTASLLTTLGIHRYLGLSKTNAGKVSEHFMIVMILSHVMFMFGFGLNDYTKLCFVIGITSHYFWLSCFAWMTTVALNLMKAMLKLRKNPNTSIANHFPFYLYVIGYGVPFLFVLPSTFLDIFSEIKIGYANGTCFPSNYPYNIIVFIGPISFSLVVNAIALIVAGHLIYKFRQSIVNNSVGIATHSYWPVYMRFFLFSGLTWSTGIIAEATGQDILRLLFIFLAGSHGLLYSVSILCSSQVKNRLRTI